MKVKMDDSEHHTVSARKISNGWVVRHSHSKGDSYKEREEFHAKKPELDMMAGSPSKTETKPAAKTMPKMATKVAPKPK